ncbi:conjugal transfer protein TrbF [Gilliamella sp. HK2]|jgi:type IV secretion system protein TrbF|nr:conjugal transfer protein TrbF [Gilliamella apicola]OCG31429.1 conjugal transfer protein TrbF [Gilliamella apicola]
MIFFSKLFKSKEMSKKRKSNGSNPYLNAKKVWNSYTGSLLSSRLIWQVTALISLLIALCATGGVIYIGSQSKYIPYIVEQNSSGRVTGSGVAYPAPEPSKIIYQAAVSDYIFYSRMVTPDVSMQKKAIFKVYSMLSDNDPAITKMNEWMKKETPFERAAKEVVNVEIKSVLQQTDSTWQIEWVESIRDRQGDLLREPFNMRALVTVYQAEPVSSKTLDEMNNNPADIYIRDFSWSELN